MSLRDIPYYMMSVYFILIKGSVSLLDLSVCIIDFALPRSSECIICGLGGDVTCLKTKDEFMVVINRPFLLHEIASQRNLMIRTATVGFGTHTKFTRYAEGNENTWVVFFQK